MLDLARLAQRRELALDARRAARVLAGELADLAVERRREEHRLPVPRQAAHELVDLRLEAHVEHAVGLVEHECAHLREVHEPAVGQILEPAGRRDEDVRVLDPVGL